ncbi:hypothetical protein TWF106_007449 [Orbilia oligospora]|uniref:Uncharacterized protein n=1 Tax=Orbilia oligospora TaxID=2813651 RepID=A0A7C8UZK6_ORBOL|nr:hypothetical protein TWF106_007449 [Orbilia oligospora]
MSLELRTPCDRAKPTCIRATEKGLGNYASSPPPPPPPPPRLPHLNTRKQSLIPVHQRASS